MRFQKTMPFPMHPLPLAHGCELSAAALAPFSLCPIQSAETLTLWNSIELNSTYLGHGVISL